MLGNKIKANWNEKILKNNDTTLATDTIENEEIEEENKNEIELKSEEIIEDTQEEESKNLEEVLDWALKIPKINLYARN
jgi:hypothetical protein